MLILECIWLSFPNYPIGCIHQRLFLLSFPLEMRIITDICIRFRDIKTFWVCELVLMFWYTAAIVLSRGILSFCKGISSGYLYSHIQIVIFCLIIHSEALENISVILYREMSCVRQICWSVILKLILKITHAAALDMPNTVRVCKVDWSLLYIRKNHSKTIFAPKLLRLKVWL